MKISLDCIPCFIRQALDAARLVSEDPNVHEKILREVLCWAGDIDMNQPAPVMGQRIHRRIRELLGNEDPYRRAKDQENRMALKLLPELKTRVAHAAEPLMMALRLAIAGNIIDMGANGHVSEAPIRESIRRVLKTPLTGDPDDFRQAIARAKQILYLTDNAGEIAFDGLLIEQLMPERVVAAVRGAPVINDATLADAQAVGLDRLVKVIDNGSDAPGTVLSDCSREFRQRFERADLILAKGQGNFETLSDEPYPIFFLFQVKCTLISKHVQQPMGTHLLMRARTS